MMSGFSSLHPFNLTNAWKDSRTQCANKEQQDQKSLGEYR